MHQASIRTHLILTYFTSVVLAVTLVPLSYHWLACSALAYHQVIQGLWVWS